MGSIISQHLYLYMHKNLENIDYFIICSSMRNTLNKSDLDYYIKNCSGKFISYGFCDYAFDIYKKDDDVIKKHKRIDLENYATFTDDEKKYVKDRLLIDNYLLNLYSNEGDINTTDKSNHFSLPTLVILITVDASMNYSFIQSIFDINFVNYPEILYKKDIDVQYFQKRIHEFSETRNLVYNLLSDYLQKR